MHDTWPDDTSSDSHFKRTGISMAIEDNNMTDIHRNQLPPNCRELDEQPPGGMWGCADRALLWLH
jgi:hypothetical protein